LKSQGKGASKETCTCVHAEQNALLAAARFGIAVDGSMVYTTVEPCFTCSKELLQAKVRRIVFCRAWGDDLKVREREALRAVQARFPDGVVQMDLALPLVLEIEYGSSMQSENNLAA
jgi:dCMP deaminase